MKLDFYPFKSTSSCLQLPVLVQWMSTAINPAKFNTRNYPTKTTTANNQPTWEWGISITITSKVLLLGFNCLSSYNGWGASGEIARSSTVQSRHYLKITTVHYSWSLQRSWPHVQDILRLSIFGFWNKWTRDWQRLSRWSHLRTRVMFSPRIWSLTILSMRGNYCVVGN
jgi:hypothetical protein